MSIRFIAAFSKWMGASLWIMLACVDAHAQPFPGLDCPGTWVRYGSGLSCRCADGSLANYVNGRIVCPGSREPPGRPPRVPQQE